MAMRITTKMMQNTSLNNLNTNKALQEKLTTQLSTMKKITRPSDDPVIAIRSLKLNASLNKIDQYYEKNSEDAESWLQLTESAIKTSVDILTSMRAYMVQGSKSSLTADDRRAIVENLSNFEKEIYATGNADSAGRSIFTGYRTDVPLTFKEDKEERYSIIEQRTNACLDTTTFVRTKDLADINEGNFNLSNTTEYNVDSYEIPRIRLAYDDLDIDRNPNPDQNTNADKIDISVKQKTIENEAENRIEIRTASYTMYVSKETTNGNINISFSDPNMQPVEIEPDSGQSVQVPGSDLEISAEDGTLMISNTSLQMDISIGYTIDNTNNSCTFAETYNTDFTIAYFEHSATDEAYDLAVGDGSENHIVYIAETGELLLGKNINAELSALPIDAEIQLKYDKSNWQEGDLDPIHYFHTTRYDELRKDPVTGEPRPLVYNPEKLTDPEENAAKQIIEYDIGSNQSIRVNTTADEVFTHDIGRDVDEVIAMLDEYSSLEEAHNAVENMIKSEKYEGDKLDKLKKEEAALDKAMTMVKDKIQKRCEGFMTDFDGYIDQAKLAQTNVGSRESRLNLIQNRLGSQQTNFQELVSENEDADVTELAIQLSSVELTYEAALSSISYVMQTSLLDFI